MAIKKIKIGSNTYDIHDARDVVVGNGVENIVTLTAAQYDALATKDPATAYIVTDRDVMADGSTYLKYQLCADEAAYNAITTKDGGTLYLIPVASS